ncbi:hypothetical protein [Paenibacillus glycanilyticus]|uniref:Uncharacterized protein n=1 Tax=Paenibacillus glycanilyticus TaxID=126569 RepID=A0ABQ6GF91_9BACL|nr:hypothetical protein [Paenibacillus glycanilyticus]GLX69624.1 hypothetical protein MU1_39690 [Paenibacillus glycanilyticus]
MFKSSMKLDEVRVLGKEKAIEQLKFLVVQQIRAAGKDEMNFSRSVSETELDLVVSAIPK